MYDIIVIGCGVIGASVAYELSKYNLKVLVLEKEIDVADGTTKANSGILHSGYDPEPGTLMAKLNVEGSKRIKGLVKKLDVQYNECGSLVLAFNKEDEKTLEKLLDNGIKNGVENLRIIDKEEVEKLEPNINKTVTKALYSPGAGVIDPWELCIAMSQVAVSNGIEIKLNSEVVDIIKEAIPAYARRKGGHPAKRTFQALRIAVNDELNVFDIALKDALDLLNLNGRISVITFHSLTSLNVYLHILSSKLWKVITAIRPFIFKICKYTFNEVSKLKDVPKGLPVIPLEMQPKFKLVNRKPIIASDDELTHNHRAHSAKLRVIERVIL